MSKTIKTSGEEYRIEVQDGGKIVLDTGNCDGEIEVVGSLIGDCLFDKTNAIISSNDTVKNIIFISFAEYIAIPPQDIDPRTMYLTY